PYTTLFRSGGQGDRGAGQGDARPCAHRREGHGGELDVRVGAGVALHVVGDHVRVQAPGGRAGQPQGQVADLQVEDAAVPGEVQRAGERHRAAQGLGVDRAAAVGEGPAAVGVVDAAAGGPPAVGDAAGDVAAEAGLQAPAEGGAADRVRGAHRCRVLLRVLTGRVATSGVTTCRVTTCRVARALRSLRAARGGRHLRVARRRRGDVLLGAGEGDLGRDRVEGGASLVEPGKPAGALLGERRGCVTEPQVALGHLRSGQGHLGQVDTGERLVLAGLQRPGDHRGDDRTRGRGVDAQAQVRDRQVEQTLVPGEGDGAGVGDQRGAVGGVACAAAVGEGERVTVEGDAAVRADLPVGDRALDVAEEGLLQAPGQRGALGSQAGGSGLVLLDGGAWVVLVGPGALGVLWAVRALLAGGVTGVLVPVVRLLIPGLVLLTRLLVFPWVLLTRVLLTRLILTRVLLTRILLRRRIVVLRHGHRQLEGDRIHRLTRTVELTE